MIVQGSGSGVLLIRQTDHALLSGAFARAWGNTRFPPFPHRQSTLVAAARHDDGWADWELAPRLDPQGRPMDFINTPVDEHVRIYRRGIDLVEGEDPYAACLVSLHGERLYTRPFHPGGSPRLRHLSGGALAAARRFVAHERRRQRRLVAEVAGAWTVGPEDLWRDLEEGWRLLQVWDRLSLFVCMQPLGAGGSVLLPPVRCARGADASVAVRAAGPHTIVLDPYPFRTEGVRFEVEAVVLERDRWEDEGEFREAYRAAPRRTLAFSAEPAGSRA